MLATLGISATNLKTETHSRRRRDADASGTPVIAKPPHKATARERFLMIWRQRHQKGSNFDAGLFD